MNYKSAVLKEFLTMSGMPSAFYLFDTSAALTTVFYTLVFVSAKPQQQGAYSRRRSSFMKKILCEIIRYIGHRIKKNVNFEFDRRVTDP